MWVEPAQLEFLKKNWVQPAQLEILKKKWAPGKLLNCEAFVYLKVE
jgi:hypothetical protein